MKIKVTLCDESGNSMASPMLWDCQSKSAAESIIRDLKSCDVLSRQVQCVEIAIDEEAWCRCLLFNEQSEFVESVEVPNWGGPVGGGNYNADWIGKVFDEHFSGRVSRTEI